MPGFNIRTVKIWNKKYFLAFKHLDSFSSNLHFIKKVKTFHKPNINQNLNKCSHFIAFESYQGKTVDSSDWYTRHTNPCGDRDPTANYTQE